jgi:hypothetical protein
MPPITTADVMAFLYILVGIMLVVALYHLLFVLVDLRRALRKVNMIATQIEDFIIKPISIMDEVLSALLALFDGGKKKKEGKSFDHKKIG